MFMQNFQGHVIVRVLDLVEKIEKGWIIPIDLDVIPECSNYVIEYKIKESAKGIVKEIFTTWAKSTTPLYKHLECKGLSNNCQLLMHYKTLDRAFEITKKGYQQLVD